jgi:hypothetical protein
MIKNDGDDLIGPLKDLFRECAGRWQFRQTTIARIPRLYPTISIRFLVDYVTTVDDQFQRAFQQGFCCAASAVEKYAGNSSTVETNILNEHSPPPIYRTLPAR